MQKMGVFLVLALLASVSTGKNIRNKRQSSGEDSDLDDRYGWNQPNFFPGPNFFPNQGPNRFPNQGPNRFPNQGPNRFPNQGPNGFPNQGSNGFPNQGPNGFPNQGPNGFPNQGQQPTTQAPAGSTTLSASVQQCISNCPVTPEYNPVCGSNSQTYSNAGRLSCAQACGVAVTQVRSTPCPVSTPPPELASLG